MKKKNSRTNLLPQFVRLPQGIFPDIAIVLCATHEHLAHILQLEEVQTKFILCKDAVEQFRERCGTDQEQSHLVDVECIADWIVESVDDSLELRTQAVEIDRRGDNEHFGSGGFLVDSLHVVFLAALAVFAGKA